MRKEGWMGSDKLIFWFEEIGREHNDIVGKKCANLGIMSQIGLPVPPGFAISIDLYRRFAQETGALEEISRHVAGHGDLKSQGITVYDNLSRNIQRIIEEREMPLGVQELIRSYYRELCKRVKIDNVAVSVRSAGIESRPGMFETYLNVKGLKEVLDKVKKVWASAYTARAIAFRVNKGLPVIGDELGVAVPKMVNAYSAGISFTVDPVTGDASKIIIESNWGLGEGVVSGVENVDRFIVKKETLEIIERAVGKKTKHVSSRGTGVAWEDVSPDKQCLPSLNDEEIKEVARLAMTIEERLGSPQDIEWAIDLDFSFPQNIFLLQTRPAKIAVKSHKSTTDHIAELMAKGFKTFH
jgi:pyruvate,water dikinase